MGLRKVTPKVQEMVKSGDISTDVALKVKNLSPEEQEEVIAKAKEDKQSAKEVKQSVQQKAEDQKAEKTNEERKKELASQKESVQSRLLQTQEKYKRKEQLVEEIKKTSEEIRGLQEGVKEKTSLQKEFEEKTKELSKHKEEKTKKEGEIQELQSEKLKYGAMNPAEVDKTEHALQKEAEKLKVDSEREISKLKRMQEELEKQKELVNKITTNLNATVTAKSEIRRKYNQNELLASQINRISFELGEIDSSIRNIEEYQQKQLKVLESLNNSLDSQTAQLLTKQKELSDLKSEQEALKKGNYTKADITKVQKELSRVEADLKALA